MPAVLTGGVRRAASRQRRSSLWSRLSPRQRNAFSLVVLLGLGIIGVSEKTAGRAFVGLVGLLLFILVVATNRKTALTLIVVWLVMLGFTRRLLIPFAGWSPQDPLLLMSPVAALLLWWSIAREESGRARPRVSTLTIAVVFVLTWSVGEAFNINEPKLLTGLEGAMFYIVPCLWFVLGRRLAEDEIQRVMDTVFWMTIPVLLSGFYQTFVGLLPFELHWIGISGQSANVFLPGFKVRPFSTLVSPQEYGIFLSFSIAVTWSKILTTKGHRLALAGLLLTEIVALFFQASRETFSLFIVSFVVVAVFRARSPAVSFAAVAAVGLAALVLLSGGGHSAVSSSPITSAPASVSVSGSAQPQKPSLARTLLDHQFAFFSNPTGGTTSVHVNRITDAFGQMVRNPLGLGPSTGDLAGQQANQTTLGAELDIPNTGQALGVPAMLAVIAIYLLGLIGVGRLYLRDPTPIHLAWIGMLVAALGQWMTGQLYCTSALTFLVLGVIARRVYEAPMARSTTSAARAAV